MAGRSDYGEWIRKCRNRKGIRSAAALAKKAGLALSHIGTFERGEYRPRWKTAQRIAQALELTPQELEEYYRVWDAAGKPAEVRSLASAPAIPGLVLWKHFPGLLYKLPHDEVIPLYVDPDQVFVDLVRSAGSVLSWMMLNETPLRKSHKRQLADLKERAKQKARATVPRMTIGDAVLRAPKEFATLSLPRWWRELLFGNYRLAARLTKMIGRWDYHPRQIPNDRDTLSIHFKDPGLEDKYGICQIEPDQITPLHDGMVYALLIDETGWRYLRQGEFIDKTAVKSGITALLEIPPDAAQAELSIPYDSVASHRVQLSRSVTKYAAILNYARFASRIFQCPFAAEITFGPAWQGIRDALSAKCVLLNSQIKRAGEVLDKLYKEDGRRALEQINRIRGMAQESEDS